MRTLGTALLALSMTGTALAGTCPAASDISQEPDEQGYAYAALGGWQGHNADANEDDLDGFRFVGVSITSTSVICRYTGESEGGVNLTLNAAKQAVGSNWNDGHCSQRNSTPAFSNRTCANRS